MNKGNMEKINKILCLGVFGRKTFKISGNCIVISIIVYHNLFLQLHASRQAWQSNKQQLCILSV